MANIRVSIPKTNDLTTAFACDILDSFPNDYWVGGEDYDCRIRTFVDEDGNFCIRIINDGQEEATAIEILKELKPILDELFPRLKQMYSSAHFSMDYLVRADCKYLDTITHSILHPFDFSVSTLEHMWYSIDLDDEDEDAEVWYSDISLYFRK